MSEIKHTPGPWMFRTDHLKGDCGIHADGTGIFAEAFADIRHQGERNKGEALANAWLIAAAPDLLEALKIAIDVMEAVDGENDCRRGTRAAYAAIAKAEGRS